MNAPWNAPISDRFSSLCARVFSPAAAILESEKTLGTRLGPTGRTRVAANARCKIINMHNVLLFGEHKMQGVILILETINNI